jgi:DNA-binding response OmpR family regulator
MLVEDDPKIAAILSAELERYGYTVTAARDYRRLKDEFLILEPDLVLLDINLPHYDGFYWCRQIRTVSRAPIIFMSARSGDVDQVRALESGGDDYIPKPFNLELALARVRSALRRSYGEYAVAQEANPDLCSAGELKLNKRTNQVSYGGQQAELTPKEFRLLLCLAEHLGQIVSREALLEALWDDVDFVDDNTLTVNVTRVRRRMADLGLPDVVETKRGQGYRLAVGEAGEAS